MRVWGLAATATSAASLAVAGTPPIDPMDAAAMRNMDWASVDQNPAWAGVKAAGVKDQALPVFPFETLRKAKTQFDGAPAELTLQVARDGSGVHRVVLSRVIAHPDECATTRNSLIRLYGEPTGKRTDTSKSAGEFDIEIIADMEQWRAGASLITQVCRTISVIHHDMRSEVYNLDFELEAATTAPPLQPVIALMCPGLTIRGKRGESSSLTVDPRLQVVSGPDGPAAPARATEQTIRFVLSGETVSIDRHTWAYAAVGADLQHPRTGACTLTGDAGAEH